MGRKPQRRYYPNRPAGGRARADAAEQSSRVDAMAQQLVNRHTPDELRSLLVDRTTLFEQADEAGMRDPGPVSLARYRSARTELDIARRAVELAERASQD